MPAPVLTAERLEKAFGPQAILRGVSFTVDERERIGLVGPNGAGKSTLARIVAGLETADAGTMARRRGAEVAFLAQEPALDTGARIMDEVLSGLGRWRAAMATHSEATDALTRGAGDLDALIEAQAAAALAVERAGGFDQEHRAASFLGHLGIRDLSAPIGALSGGERRRVALAKILVAAPDLAILDEPTNHLDVEAIEWLEEHLARDFPGAVWLITHDRYVLDRVVTRTLELEGGALHSYDGGYGRYLEGKAERLAHEARAEANRQNFLRREIEWLRRSPAARTTKQKARIDRAEAAIAVKGPARAARVDLAADSVRLGKTIVDLDDVGLEVTGRRLVHGLSLALTEGMRLGVIGRNGAGKTSLLRAILGTLAPDDAVRLTGEIRRGSNTRFAYFDQLRSGLTDDATILDNVAGGQLRVEVGGRVMDSRAYLERFLFDGAKQRQKVSSLSGGERARVALAKHLLAPANVLVLDEPTNDLDVETLAALEGLLTEFPGCAILVSHDRYFLDRVATDILAFEGDGLVVHQPGDYSTYKALLDERRRNGAGSIRAGQGTEPTTRPGSSNRAEERPDTATPEGPKPLTYKERKELDGLLERVDAAETRVREAEARLADPALYQGGKDAAELARADLDAARAEVATLTARWEELASRDAAAPGRGH